MQEAVRHHMFRLRIQTASTMLAVLLLPAAAAAQPPELWGSLLLPRPAADIRDRTELGAHDRRLDATLLVDFVRRYANTDLTAAALRLERYLTEISPAAATSDAAVGRDTSLPLPLPSFWHREVFVESVAPIASLLRSRELLLTYHGLMALDDTTLAVLAAQTDLMRTLSRSRTGSAAFATFGQSLRVSEASVLTPGGSDAVAVWVDLVGHPATEIDAFVLTLFERDGGRLAYFYDTVAALPAATQQFVLAAHVPPAERASAVRRIYSLFSAADPNWRIDTRPFYRPPFDAALALLALDVGADGTVGPDWWPGTFDRVGRMPAWQPYDAMPTLAPRPTSADVRWVFDWVFDDTVETARRRYAALRFAQRVMPSTQGDTSLVADTLRGVLEMPALMFSLERMGMTDLSVLSAVARTAHALTLAGSEGRALPALSRWQALLGLLEQVRRHSALPPERLATLLRTLAAAPGGSSPAPGFAATWLHEELLPAMQVLPTPSPTLEDAFLEAATASKGRPTASFEWEGLAYFITPGQAALTSARTIRHTRTGLQLQDVIELHLIRKGLEASTSVAERRQLIVRLERLQPLAARLADLNPDAARDLTRVLAALGGSTGESARQRLPDIVALLDAFTDAVIPSLLYALAVSPTPEPVLYPEAWTRHTLAQPVGVFLGNQRDWRTVAWQFPTDYGLGGGTRLVGSWLAVDVALIDAQMVRVATDVLPVPGVLERDMRKGVIEVLALAPPPPDAARDTALVSGLSAGRRVIDEWIRMPPARAELATRLRSASVDGVRANAIAWQRHHTGPTAFDNLSASEVWWLGATSVGAEVPVMAGWSGSSRLVDGCLCRLDARMVTHERLRGRRVGVQAFRPHDVPVRLAELLGALGLDTSVLPLMLPMALQDWLDHSLPAWLDDAEAFTFWPRVLDTERVEAYLLQLIASGVLSPPPTAELSR
jgi:hypothetical protein